MARTIALRRDDLTQRAREALRSANPASWRATPGLADWARPPHWATRVEPLPPGLENLWSVAPGLYRSGQPTAEGFRSLDGLGVRTVVSLRQTVSDLPLAAGTAVAVVRIPMKSRFVAEDRGARVVRAMRAVRAGMEIGGVAVHCRHGSDRTGLIMALWRILYEGWTRQQALDELIAGGYGYHPIWANIPRYLRKVDLKDLRGRIEGWG